jgi:hypothetical protein
MKKRCVVVCAVVLLLAAFAAAPALVAVEINFGLKAGGSLSNVSWTDDDGSEKGVLRPTFGVFAVFNLSPSLAIQPEVNYLSTGEKWVGTSMTLMAASYKDEEFFNYLHIPVLVKYRFAMDGNLTPVVFAGPAVGVLLSARYKEYEDGELIGNYDDKQFYKSMDFGADFGVGAEIAVSNFKVLLDLRYYLGLINQYYAPLKYEMKNRALMFTVGGMF